MKFRNFTKAILVLSLPAIFIGCAKDENAKTESPVRAAEYSTRFAELFVNWVSQKCNPVTGIPGIPQYYFKVEYDYPTASDAFIERTQYFSDAACSQNLATVKYAGNLEIADPGNQSMGSRELNLTYKQAFVSAQNEDGKKFLNLIKLCGVSNYEMPAPGVNHEVEVTPQSGDVACLGQVKNARNRVRYDRYVVSNGVLLMGSGYVENDGLEDPAKRPPELDQNEPFVKR